MIFFLDNGESKNCIINYDSLFTMNNCMLFVAYYFIHFHSFSSNVIQYVQIARCYHISKRWKKACHESEATTLKVMWSHISMNFIKAFAMKVQNLQNKNYMIKDCGQNAVLMLSQYWDTCKQITGSENTMVFSLRDVLTMFWWFRKWIDVWMFLFSQLRKRKYSIAVLQYHRSLRYVWSPAVSS